MAFTVVVVDAVKRSAAARVVDVENMLISEGGGCLEEKGVECNGRS
jgi:hypothetical protein